MNDFRIEEIIRRLKQKDPYANKGNNGTLSVIAGSEYYRGAASLAVMSALRSGVGIVRLISVEDVISAASSHCPECVFLPILKTGSGAICADDFEAKKDKAFKANAILVGCGMTDCDDTRSVVVSVLSSFDGAVTVDADGLNSIKNCPSVLASAKVPPIITPHIGEMSRLMGLTIDEIKNDREKTALDFASRYRCTVVLKDYITVIASCDGQKFVLDKPNAGLAKGGSGDVLSGIISGLTAQGYDGFSSAVTGVCLHSYAAELAAGELSEFSALPSDIINYLPKTFLRMLCGIERK